MYSNLSSCPQELLLFFHNVPWSHPIRLGNGSSVPLIDYIEITSDEALASTAQHARLWDALEGVVDRGRWEAVQARFRQQQVDALAFSEVITGYYRNVSEGRHAEPSKLQLQHRIANQIGAA
jgi:alpha-glucuronidase